MGDRIRLMWLFLLGSLLTFSEALSVDDMSRAFALDTFIVHNLKNFLKEVFEGASYDMDLRNETQFLHISKYIEEYDQVFGSLKPPSNSSEGVSVEAAADPLKSLVLARRLSRDWPTLVKMFHKSQRQHSSVWNRVKSAVLEEEKELAILIGEESRFHLSNSFARLVDVYKLGLEDLADDKAGSQQEVPFSFTTLRTIDAALISDAAFNEKMFGTAVELLNKAERLIENENPETSKVTSKKTQTVLRQLQHLNHVATSLHDYTLEKGTEDDSSLQQPGMYPLPFSKVPLPIQKQKEEPLPDPLTFHEKIPTSSGKTNEDVFRFSQLCRGHNFMSISERSKMKCHLDTMGSPYLLLMPAMVEENSLNPKVLTFHQILTAKQIQDITSTARPLLEQALVQSEFIGSSTTYKIRSSYTAWLRETTLPLLAKLNKKISALTGLDVNENKTAAEVLQVNLYASGGYYTPHLDTFNLKEKAADFPSDVVRGGDRFATFMFYMNDVEAGGYTVFPRIGVGVQPRAGNAVFWSNLLPDGSEDRRTMHGACPVLKGIKWVSNKWIRYNQQFLLKPCPYRS